MECRVATQSKQETVYNILKSRIEQLQYAPSQRLVIDTLARELGISQVPIREAIRRLEAEGLVHYSANTGPIVAPVSRDQWFQLKEIVAVLEGYATASAAPNIGPSEIAVLRKINSDMEKALTALDLPTWLSKNREFHEVIHAQCENKALAAELSDAIRRTDTVSLLVFARERGVIIQTLGINFGRETIKNHEEIITALAQRAPASRIERITRRHVLDPVMHVKRALQRLAKERGPSRSKLGVPK